MMTAPFDIAQREGENTETDGAGEAVTDVVGKTALGAGVGTLLGIAALAFPRRPARRGRRDRGGARFPARR